MQRELANKMYTPTAYYLGRFLSNLILQFAYPVIMVLSVFWLTGIDTEWENFLFFMSFGLLGNFVFCGQGFFMGIAFDEGTVWTINTFSVLFFTLGNGAFANLDSATWFVKFLSKVSPARFNLEGIFFALSRQVTEDSTYPFEIS